MTHEERIQLVLQICKEIKQANEELLSFVKGDEKDQFTKMIDPVREMIYNTDKALEYFSKYNDKSLDEFIARSRNTLDYILLIIEMLRSENPPQIMINIPHPVTWNGFNIRKIK